MRQYGSLRAYVRNYISDGIYNGQFKLGDRISEQSIADKLGVSRTPAREALMQLHCEGTLDYTPRRGFTIRNVTEKEQRDIDATIGLLDAFAASSALLNITTSDINDLRECVEKIDVAIKYHNNADYRELQNEFHDIYRRRCDNEVILRFLEILQSGLAPPLFECEDAERFSVLCVTLNSEHRHIIELFEKRDPLELFTYLFNVHWATERAF